MKRETVLWLCVGVLLAATAALRAGGEGEGPRSPEQMREDAVKKAEQCLEDLSKSKDLTRVREALALVGEVWDGDKGGVGWKRFRKASFELRLELLDIVDRNIDEAFDPEDAPCANVLPPLETGEDAAVDPKEIDDPKLREEYETAIRLNEEKAERYDFQAGLRKARRLILWRLGHFIKESYDTSPGDAQEVDQLVEACLSKESTRDEIKASIVAENEAADKTQPEEPEEPEDPADDPE